MTINELKLIYPGSSLSELTTLGLTEVNERFEALKAIRRARLDGSPESELPRIKAEVLFLAEIQNCVLEQMHHRDSVPVQST